MTSLMSVWKRALLVQVSELLCPVVILFTPWSDAFQTIATRLRLVINVRRSQTRLNARESDAVSTLQPLLIAFTRTRCSSTMSTTATATCLPPTDNSVVMTTSERMNVLTTVVAT